MLDIYEFADGAAFASAADNYPKEFIVDWAPRMAGNPVAPPGP